MFTHALATVEERNVGTNALGSIVHYEGDKATTTTKGRIKNETISQPLKTQTILLDVPSMSNRLSLLMNHSAAAFALRGSVKSIGSQTSSPGCSPIPSCSIRTIASSAFSSLLAARYTFAPRLTRWSAMYRPIPELSIFKRAGLSAVVPNDHDDALGTSDYGHAAVQVEQVSLWGDTGCGAAHGYNDRA
jgi:hypothetical protein